jgi:Zn-dependent protease
MEPVALAVFGFIAFIFSVMIHEVSHGVVAEWLGDSTARDAGRITLNPLKHIDPMGSIILPVFLLIVGSPFMLGWAKPVPYDPRFLKNPKTAAGKIAGAGPASNFIIAILFALFTRVAIGMDLSPALIDAFAMVVVLNISLAVFNLVPIPPLDGSKVLFALLPASRGAYAVMELLERYGMILIFALLFFAGSFLFPIVTWIFNLLVL